MDELLLRSLIGGVLLAMALGPLGCFAVWRHMAYFGDTIAHAALLGVALFVLTEVVSLTLAMLLVALMIAFILSRLNADKRFSSDTILGILSHGTLAFGVLLIALSKKRVDLDAYLFGDILAMSWNDVFLLGGIGIVVLFLLRLSWRPLLMVTLHPAIAHVEGVHVKRTQLLLTLLLAAVIALSIKLVGVLLITALLIIPAASARYLAASPTAMALWASGMGALSVTAGVLGSFSLDTPTGPTIVVMSVFVFVLLATVARIRNA